MGAAPEIAWKTGADGRHHSGLIWAARITLAHFCVSSARSLPNSAGVSASAVPPRSAKRALILGSARAVAISLLSLSTIAAGVCLGAPTPSQSPASKPGTNSLTVGTSGSACERVAAVTASARSFPVLMYSIDPAIPANEIMTCPPRRSANAGPAPRYGLGAAEKRQPQQWLEKSVSRLCPGGGRDRGGDSEGAARSSRPLAKLPPPGLGSRRSEFPLSRVASCPTTVEAARRLPSGRSKVRSKLACEPTAPGDEV